MKKSKDGKRNKMNKEVKKKRTTTVKTLKSVSSLKKTTFDLKSVYFPFFQSIFLASCTLIS